MLIRIDDTGAADACRNNVAGGRSLAAIESLLRSHYDGKHIVSLSRASVSSLENCTLSARARGALKHVRGIWSEIEGLRSALPWHLELGATSDFDGREHCFKGSTVIRAPLHAFEDSERGGAAVLIGENLTDVRLFICLVKAYLVRGLARSKGRLESRSSPRGGGGHTTATVFSAESEQGKIVLAVADSDISYAGGPPRSTWSALRDAAAMRPAYQRAWMLPVRAAENLLPLSLYERVVQEHSRNKDLSARVTELRKLEIAKLPVGIADWYCWADLKRGVTLAILDGWKDNARKAYWGRVARASGKPEDCWMKPRCGPDKLTDCRCVLVAGLSESILEHAVAWLERQSPRHVAELIDVESRPDVAALCALVASWTAALPPLRV